MYYIIEIQEQADGTGAILTFTEPTENQALSKWHSVLTFASVSEVFCHSAVVLDSEGKHIARESYMHYPQVEEVELND